MQESVLVREAFRAHMILVSLSPLDFRLRLGLDNNLATFIMLVRIQIDYSDFVNFNYIFSAQNAFISIHNNLILLQHIHPS